jgi:phenylalanyl-tRNA synthetase beta chain
VVDATNYVLHELGQPLHAFDADRIHGKSIVVRTAKTGDKFMTLDGEERNLHEEDLMICDSEKPMCIAGIFGGINTGVTESTKAIFLESAYFDPISIRKTAKRHGLSTDASFRFERGIDIDNVEYALRRAAILIKELTGGDITSDLIDLYPKKMQNYQVFLTFAKINTLIGQELARDTIKSILASLDIQVKSVTESGLGLEIPFYRVDVQREVDVIEEILRVYGYNNVHFGKKLNASIAPVSKYEDYNLEDKIGNLLASQGYNEIVTNSLTNPDYAELISTKGAVMMLNPLSTELSVMRQSMLFTGLESIAHNINRKNSNLRFFEFGKTYEQIKDGHKEQKNLALFITGNTHENHWASPTKKSDFFLLKAAVENVLERLGIKSSGSAFLSNDIFSEGLELFYGKTPMVSLGLVKNDLLNNFDIKQEVLYANLNWQLLVDAASKNKIYFKDIPKYPEVTRDFALLLDQSISFAAVEDLGYKTEKKLLKDISLFDVYTGNKLPKGKKSYAVSFTIQDEAKTLTDAQIEKLMKKLQKSYERELGAELR